MSATLELCFVFWLPAMCIALKETIVAELDQNHLNIEGEIQEYCVSKEPFEASCLKNEVIVMTSAVYGRIKLGRCLQSEERQLFVALGNDPKFIGCSEDVMHLMNRKCSGRKQCMVRSKDFESFKPCYEALQLYLEASFKCRAVIESDRSCHVPVSSNPLHIIISSDTKLGCGTKTQPWVIEAPQGQQINVSLLDFGLNTKEPITHQMDSCQQYGYIIDKTAKKNVSICRQGHEGQSLVYRSQSNMIQIFITNVSSLNSDVPDVKSEVQSIALVGIYAVGCSNIVPPEDTWLRRNANEATVGCYSSHQTWHLRCTENQWIGVIGNCSRESTIIKPQILELGSSSINLNQVTVIVSIIVLTVIFCVTIICCGAVCLKRHYAISSGLNIQRVEDNNKKLNKLDVLLCNNLDHTQSE